ncbi:MAG: alpha/beta hydrolase [Deltaproteobacteria bacterium]|nr:alpha/beta hydrolase [Deltaproteobacteria bacterium]
MKTSSEHASRLGQITRTREDTVSSFDGTRIWYRSVGSGVPIVCLNGLGCSTFYFSYLENYFKDKAQVVTWDYRGHGRSEMPRVPKNHTVSSLKQDLKAVLKALQIKKAILVGHSMGVQVMFEFYNSDPDRVIGMVSCFGTSGKPMDTFYNFPLSKYAFEVIYIFNHLFPRLSNTLGTLVAKNPFWFQMGGLFKMMKPYLADKRIMRQYLEHIINVDAIFLSKLTRSLQEHNAEGTLKRIRAPVLIIGADEDNFTPAWVSKKMHHQIPHSELFIVKKGSHVALVEQPELLNLRIEKFIRERLGFPPAKFRDKDLEFGELQKESVAIGAEAR